MNRNRALEIADRVMARIETDKAVHKDAIADEVQAAESLPEIVDIISHDGEKWVRKDGTAFEPEHEPSVPTLTNWMLPIAIRIRSRD